MHYFQWNIGDYAKHTQHLTNEEDIAYRRALDLYYDTEKPLDTQNIPLLSRRLRVDCQALQNVIDEFFPDGKNTRADKEIEEYYAFLNRQRINGSKGGRGNKASANPDKPTANPSPSQPLTTNHKPLTIKQDKSSSATNVAGVEYSKAFLTFWDMYPNRKNKGAAFKAFKKINPAEYPAIKEGLEAAKRSSGWLKDNGQYIPHPASWLNARGWEDESEQQSAGSVFNMEEWIRAKQ